MLSARCRFAQVQIFRRSGIEAMVSNKFLSLIPAVSFACFCPLRQHLSPVIKSKQHHKFRNKAFDHPTDNLPKINCDVEAWVKFQMAPLNHFSPSSDLKFADVTVYRNRLFFSNNEDNIFFHTEIGVCDKPLVLVPTFSLLQVKNSVLQLFGGQLIKDGNAFFVDSEVDLPVMDVYLTPEFANKHLCRVSGTGVYLERHSSPHIHRPQHHKSGGFLILAKEVAQVHNNSIVEQHFQLVALSIPFGYSFVTPPNVWHNDCFLSGDYEVAYTSDATAETISLASKIGWVQ